MLNCTALHYTCNFDVLGFEGPFLVGSSLLFHVDEDTLFLFVTVTSLIIVGILLNFPSHCLVSCGLILEHVVNLVVHPTLEMFFFFFADSFVFFQFLIINSLISSKNFCAYTFITLGIPLTILFPS
jgi:hypothetical protein